MLLRVFALWFLSFATGLAESRPNIVWLICEDMDPILGCYGDPLARTPHLDALAEGGILYRNAFANAPICAPARSCLMTGVYPTALGTQHLRSEVVLPPTVKPLVTWLREAGYFVSNQAKTDYNFSPDGLFDYWRDDRRPWRQRKNTEQPFFSFFHLGMTHEGPANLEDRFQQATASLSGTQRLSEAEIASVELPPYYPQTAEMRRLWARYHELAAAMDDEVGKLVAGLKDDGLWEDTIVFFASDHGHGLPGHKRWLLDRGLRVPFIVRIPEKYADLAPNLAPGSETDRLVSFVDFAPTTLSLVGEPIPEAMQGRAFLGKEAGVPRERIFAARDRADDMFERSRAVHDGRFLYVRHYFAHLPYLQGGKIFGPRKLSFAELHRAREAGEIADVAPGMYGARKPIEALYDLETDPHEVVDLAGDPAHRARVERMRGELHEWILEHRDVGFLSEAEVNLRSREAGLTIYEYAQDEAQYELPKLLAAAEAATRPETSVAAMREMLRDEASGVRYWGAIGLLSRGIAGFEPELRGLLDDASPSVAITAARALVVGEDKASVAALEVLAGFLESEHRWVQLEAARTLENVGAAAGAVVERMAAVRKSLERPEVAEGEGFRRYRSFNFPSFTGWALESALVNCGVAEWADFE